MKLNGLLINDNLQVTSLAPIRVFTNRVGVTSSYKIDYILINVDKQYCKSRVYEGNFSDHKIFYTSLVDCKTVKSSYFTYTDVSAKNLKWLSLTLSDTSFEATYCSSDLDKSFQVFMDILSSLTDKCCLSSKYKGSVRNSTEVTQVSRNLENMDWL